MGGKARFQNKFILNIWPNGQLQKISVNLVLRGEQQDIKLDCSAGSLSH